MLPSPIDLCSPAEPSTGPTETSPCTFQLPPRVRRQLTYDSDDNAAAAGPAKRILVPETPEAASPTTAVFLPPATSTCGKHRLYGLTIHAHHLEDTSMPYDATCGAGEDDLVRADSTVFVTDKQFRWVKGVYTTLSTLRSGSAKPLFDWLAVHLEFADEAIERAASTTGPASPHAQCIVHLKHPLSVVALKAHLDSKSSTKGAHIRAYAAAQQEHACRYVWDPEYQPSEGKDKKPASLLFKHPNCPDASGPTQGRRSDVGKLLEIYGAGGGIQDCLDQGIKPFTLVQGHKLGTLYQAQKMQEQPSKLRYVADIHGPPGTGKTRLVQHLCNPAVTAYLRADSAWEGALMPHHTTIVYDDFFGFQPFRPLMSYLTGCINIIRHPKGGETFRPNVERVIFTSLYGIAHYYAADHKNGEPDDVKLQCSDRITHSFVAAPTEEDPFHFALTHNPNARCLCKLPTDNVERDTP